MSVLRSQDLRGWLLGKIGVTFFRGVAGISIYDKKGLKTKIFLPLITKNLNWEILTKNLVTFEGWDWVKDEKI